MQSSSLFLFCFPFTFFFSSRPALFSNQEETSFSHYILTCIYTNTHKYFCKEKCLVEFLRFLFTPLLYFLYIYSSLSRRNVLSSIVFFSQRRTFHHIIPTPRCRVSCSAVGRHQRHAIACAVYLFTRRVDCCLKPGVALSFTLPYAGSDPTAGFLLYNL